MNRAYWDRQTDHWDDEIFDSLSENVNGVIRKAILAAGRRHRSAIDFGCGVGGYLALLARTFEQVHAVDWSARCVDQSRRRADGWTNVTVERASPRVLTRLARSFGCVVAANVVIHPDSRVRERLWASIRRMVKRGGTGIFVAPSLESAAYCEFMRRQTAPGRPSAYDFHPRMQRPEAGTVSIQGVPTKHYTGEELAATFALSGFHLTTLARANYRWSSEALVPPRRMNAELPWDWLAVARAV